jgi:putative spermidine/putrescine transport system ATP-binding protein
MGRPVEGLSGSGTLSIRPEDLVLGAEGEGLPGRVVFVRDLGATVEVFVELGDRTLTAVLPPRERGRVAVGQTVGLRLPAEACVLLPA